MAGPVFNTDFEPRYGDTVEVSPLLRRVVCNNPSKFTYYGTGTYVIGHGDVAVIDPGPRDPTHIDALLQALDGETVHPGRPGSPDFHLKPDATGPNDH